MLALSSFVLALAASSLSAALVIRPAAGYSMARPYPSKFLHKRSLGHRGLPVQANSSANAVDASAGALARRHDDDMLGSMINGAFKGLKGIGEAVGVTITWYTGNDLKNPSCWSESVWTPTDDALVCALTLDGWETRPKCFAFLELCNGDKCVFVRVVDTCAGCKKGSQHVDLTLSAFKALANPDTGIVNDVQMRPATEPSDWNEKLWGPRVSDD